MERLFAGAEDQDICRLYSLIRQDPDFLQAFDRKQFADTPLHIAAGEGRTELALEIQRLMPSLGMKLNPDGFSPLDLAMRGGHTKTVRTMIMLNPELAGVQGREGFTPLHYAAETDDVDALAKFLLICPSSIEALTVRGETAVHVAVKNRKFSAFRVLLGWLIRTARRDVLRWEDFDGNNALHLAAYSNQPKVMELIVNHVGVNFRNLEGLTALDIVMELGDEVNGQALQILQKREAERGSSLINPHKYSTLANYFISPVSIGEEILKLHVLLDTGLPSETRNAILVVAVLIATAMYQGVLSPPGGFNGDAPVIFNTTTPSNTSLTTNITGNIFKLDNELETQPGRVLMQKIDFDSFTLLNTLTFAASVSMIILVLPTRPYNSLIFIPLGFFMVNYSYVIEIICPSVSPYYILYMILLLTIVSAIVALKTHVISYHLSASRFSTGNNYSQNFSEIKKRLFESKYLRTKSQGKS